MDSSSNLTEEKVINVETPEKKDVNFFQKSPEKKDANLFPEKKDANLFPEKKDVNFFPEEKDVNTFPEKKDVNTFPEKKNVNTFPEKKNVNTFPEKKDVNAFPEKKDVNIFQKSPEKKNMITPTVINKATLQEKSILTSVVCKYLLYVIPTEVNSQKAIQNVTENNVQIVDVKSLKKKPDWLKGVPTIVEVSTGKVYEGTHCLLLLKNDIEELNVDTSNCYRDKPKQAIFMFSNVMKQL